MLYPFEANTRVVVAATVANINAPKIGEVNGGVDITCDLTKDGLLIAPSDATRARPRWSKRLVEERWVGYSMAVALRGWRHRTTAQETLWPLAVAGTAKSLIVRRGVPYGQWWAPGDRVEVINFEFGKRSVERSARATNVSFGVALLANAHVDETGIVNA